jgi:hypothetical protein
MVVTAFRKVNGLPQAVGTRGLYALPRVARGGWTHATGITHAQLGRTRGLDARESSTHAQLGRTRGLDARMAWTHATVPRTVNLDARGGWKHAMGATHTQLGRTRGLDARQGSTARAIEGHQAELLRATGPSY